MTVDGSELRKGDRIRATRKGNPALFVEGVVLGVQNHDVKIDGMSQWFVGHCWTFDLIERPRVLPTKSGWYIRESSVARASEGSIQITIWRLSAKGTWAYSGDISGWVEVQPDVVPTNLVRLVPQENSDGC